MERYVLSADLGGTSCKIGLFDEATYTIIRKWTIPTDTSSNGKNILSDINKSIKKYMDKESIHINQIKGMGFGVPGCVTNSGVVNKCVNLGWDVVDVRNQFRKMSGIDNVKVANDANLAALGEAKLGSGKGSDCIVMLTLGTGIGGGIIIGDNILNGSMGAAGEIGHIVVNEDELEKCNCGNKGCLEQYASATGIVRVANRFMKEKEYDSPLYDYNKLSAKIIFDNAKKKDILSNEIISYCCAYLGKAIAIVCNIINPSVVVIGGGVSNAGEIIVDKLMDSFKDNVFHSALDTDIRLASLCNDAGIFGAALLVTEEGKK